MKAFKWMGAAAAAVLLLLTSCLGDSDNTMTRPGFAVAGISEKTYKPVLNTVFGAMYSPGLETKITQGACYGIQYELDFNSPENANAVANGYYTAAITILEEISKGQAVYYNVPDTAVLLPNEESVKNIMGNAELGVYVDGNLFLYLTSDIFKDQKNDYILYWDRSKGSTMVDDIPTYSLFLRSVKTADGTGSSATSTASIRAFDVKSVFESVNSEVIAQKHETFNLKINYLSSINEKDKSDLKWSAYTIRFQAAKK